MLVPGVAGILGLGLISSALGSPGGVRNLQSSAGEPTCREDGSSPYQTFVFFVIIIVQTRIIILVLADKGPNLSQLKSNKSVFHHRRGYNAIKRTRSLAMLTLA